MEGVVDGCIVVSLDETKEAMRLMAEKARIILRRRGSAGARAALSGKAGQGPIVAIVSGGNIDLKDYCDLIGNAQPR
jgi:threonine dehydratase